MNGYVTNIERDTIANDDFRRVLFTGPNTQLVLMTLQPGEDIGLETHHGHDQFIRVEQGRGGFSSAALSSENALTATLMPTATDRLATRVNSGERAS